ncbi:MAG TPA: hypothetical protein ENN29_03370 [Candidatus Hydrogenedentes bacterium]|nr:hypothetical protein [Candidatus Hydrogenedentota bacterium]
MNNDKCGVKCAFEQVAQVEFRNLAGSVRELKERMTRLEQTLAKGIGLLVANLAGMVIMLMGRLLG